MLLQSRQYLIIFSSLSVPLPPDNQGTRPSGTSNDPVDRFGGFEEDDRPIWGAQNIIPKGESGSKGIGIKKPGKLTFVLL